TLTHEALDDLRPARHRGRVVSGDIGYEIIADDTRFQVDQGGQDGDLEGAAELAHHIVQTGTLSYLGAMKFLYRKGRQGHKKDGHPHTAYDQGPKEVADTGFQGGVGQHPSENKEQKESTRRQDLTWHTAF